MFAKSAIQPPALPGAPHPVLQSFARECHGLLARLTGYVGALALIAIAGFQIFVSDAGPPARAMISPVMGGPALSGVWSKIADVEPAFIAGDVETSGITASYEAYEHPDGGRRDVVNLLADGEMVGELALLHLGQRTALPELPVATILSRMDPGGTRAVSAQTTISTKFGAVSLLGFADRPADQRNCLGFTRTLDGVNLRISGWLCRDESIAALRATLTCMLDQISLRHAESPFTRSRLLMDGDLKRSGCSAPAMPVIAAASADTRYSLLRGPL